MAWLRILCDPPLGLYDRRSERAKVGDLSWQRLTKIAASGRALGPGAEAPNVSVSLDNGDGGLTEVLYGSPPLGARCECGDGVVLIATGRLTRIVGAAELQLTVEGGA